MQTKPPKPREFWRLIVKRFLHKRKHHAVDHCRSLQKQKTHATARNGNNANETAENLRAVNETAETLRTVLCELQILLCKNKYFTLLKPAETETARNATKPHKPPETHKLNRPSFVFARTQTVHNEIVKTAEINTADNENRAKLKRLLHNFCTDAESLLLDCNFVDAL